MPVVSISSPICMGQGAFPVAYDVYKFTVTQSGSYSFALSIASGNLSLYLFEGNFTPAAAFPDCVAADNSDPIGFSYSLTAGTVYYAVPFDDSLGQDGGSYSLKISGPGDICLNGVCGAEEPVPGCDVLIAIPSTAVGAKITADTLAYWKPGEATQTLLKAGTSVRAIKQENGWYEILYVCDFLYVPAGTLGPNPESPWFGAPLP